MVSTPDPPLSVIARAHGALVEFVVTGDGADVPDIRVLMSTEKAVCLKLQLDEAIWAAKKAVPYIDRLLPESKQ